MGLQPLNEVRKALSSAWDLTRAGFWWRTAESAAVDRQWDVAATRLLKLADALEHVEHGAPAWHQLLIAALDAAVRAESIDLVEASCAQVFGRAFSGNSDVAELQPIFALANRGKQFAIGSRLGHTVRQRVPTSPWGHYAAGHFDELLNIEGGGPRPTRVVRAFERAAVLFGPDTPEGKHAQLRAAVAQLAYTNEGEAGRSALRDATREVHPADEAWVAHGRTFSSFWLDRVRAADWVGDELTGREYGDEARGARAVSVAASLCRNLPAELTDAEEDRLQGAGEALEGRVGAAILEQVALRAELAERLPASLDSFKDSPDELRDFRELNALIKAWNGEESLVAGNGFANDVVRVLLAPPDDRVSALETLAASARDVRGDALKPVVLVLARLGRGDGCEPLEEVAIHYAWRATPPSCGFLPLAHRAFAAGIPRAGAALTRRGLDAGEADSVRETCVARSVRWASEHASDAELLRWLEVGEELLAD